LTFSLARSEIEEREMIKFLDAKRFVLDRIVAELASVDGEQVYRKNAVEYWIGQVKLGSSDVEDEAKHGRPPLHDMDARILAGLNQGPFSSIRSIAQALGLTAATVHPHLTMSLDLQPRHFRWVPHVLARELRVHSTGRQLTVFASRI
jgi:hypothetical protein